MVEDAHSVSLRVKQALSKISSEHRELLLQKYVDQKKVKQMARDWGKSPKSIESELFRARESFKKAYSVAHQQ